MTGGGPSINLAEQTMETTAALAAPSRRHLVRTIYLYLVAFLGVLLLTVGGVRFLDMGLKALVFTSAEQEETMHVRQPPIPFALERARQVAGGSGDEFTPEERAMAREWLREYEAWRERTATLNPVLARRQRTASSSLAMILIGLPLYLYHWALIRREWQA
jgi:hypothetical protein